MTNLIGQSLGRYHILEQLGEGGMATVYKAYDTRLERDVAVKVIRVDQFPPAALERILKRFEREAKALARLTHPNIVHINDYGEHGNVPYLVMDYLPGGTLKERMKGKPMPWQEAVRLLIPIASALDFAHEHKVVHRDVKPANILLTEKGQSMLSDFGIAKILELDEGHTLTGTGMGVGTPEYMSPEQGLGKEVDGRADIYSMGIIFYELITGRKPYSADTPMAVILKHTTDPLPRPRQFLPNLPEAVERVVLKALAKDPADRYPDAGAFANAMEKLISGSQTQTASNEESDDSLETMDAFATNVQFSSESNSRNKAPASVKKENITSTNLPKNKSNLAVWIGLGVTGIVLISVLVGWLARGSSATAIPLASTPIFTATPIPTNTIAPTNTQVLTSTPTIIPTPTLGIGSTMTGEDGMTMLYVPAGEFIMGADNSTFPSRVVYLDAFWIDQTEVTNELFSAFVNSTGYKTDAEKTGRSTILFDGGAAIRKGIDWRHPTEKDSTILGKDQFPVVHVSWDDAVAYCAWVGRRLPTEAEWEKAARGTDGRIYPWGNNKPDETLLNINYFDYEITSVGNYPKGVSPYGAYDMEGNVEEWVNDWYSYSQSLPDPVSNPIGPSSGKYRVFRYGVYSRSGIEPSLADNIIGFRCARSK